LRRLTGPGLTRATERWANSRDELDAARLERLSGELVALKAALARLEHGECGVCADCGDFVGLIRLKALPFTRRCRDCQSRIEVKTARAKPIVRVADLARPD
jgi:DnaK suppressor protein